MLHRSLACGTTLIGHAAPPVTWKLICAVNSPCNICRAGSAAMATLAGQTIHGTWRLDGRIGVGGFGEVYAATHVKNGRTVAVKVATDEDGVELLQMEAKVYKGLRNTPSEIVGVPEMRYFERGRGRAVLVMELLGPALTTVIKGFGGRFSLKTTLMVGIQMLRRLQLVHHKGYIHRDVKPDNMLVGKKDTSRVYLVDFGVASKYRDYETRTHMGKRNAKTIIGSIPYISLNAHRGIEQSRRDDLESLGYTLVFLFTGTLPWQEFEIRLLPWQNVNKISELKLYNLIANQKRKTSLQALCQGMPKQMLMYMQYVRALKFDQRPDYAYLRGLFRKALKDQGLEEDRVFDWTQKRKEKKKS